MSECHLLDVLQRDAVLAQLLIDKDQREEVAHPAVEQLVREPAGALHHPLVVLQQPGEGHMTAQEERLTKKQKRW